MKKSMYLGRNASWFDCIKTHVKQISQSPCFLRNFSASKTLVAWAKLHYTSFWDKFGLNINFFRDASQNIENPNESQVKAVPIPDFF